MNINIYTELKWIAYQVDSDYLIFVTNKLSLTFILFLITIIHTCIDLTNCRV